MLEFYYEVLKRRMSDALRVNNLHFGNLASNYNQAHIGFTSVGIGSTTNYGFLQFFGVPNTLCWTANGTVGIGMTNPSTALHVNGTITASRIIVNSYHATDDRSINPSEIPINSLKPFFSSWDNNSGGFYADAIGFNTYTDSSGGNENVLMIYKNGFGIRQYQGAFNSTSRFSDYMDCCMKTDGTQSLTSFTATAYTPNPTLTIGCKTGANPMYSVNQAGVIVTDGNLHIDASRRSSGSSAIYYGFYANQDGNANNHQFYGSVSMNSALNTSGTVTTPNISTTTYNGVNMRFATVTNNDAPNGGPGYNAGYVVLVGGLCIQWGMKSSQNGGNQWPSYIIFPIAFTTVYICLGCSGYGAASGPGSLSNTGCNFSAGGNTVTYIAIGYKA